MQYIAVRRMITLLAVALAALVAPSAARASVTVTDNAQQAGVFQISQSFDTLVFDYNGDGLQDFLYSPQNAPAGRQLWRNNGDGTFTLVTYLKGSVTTDQHGCTTADYDGNGLPDVFCSLGAVHGTRTKADPLWLQQPDGSWTLDEASGAQDPLGRGYSATTLDANGDGLPDLFLDDFHPRADSQPTPDRLYLNLGADPATGAWLGFADDPGSGLETEQGNRGCDLTTDFNHDHLPDIVFCGTGTVRMYQNNGDGTFTDVHSAYLGGTSWFASDLKFADVNGDGRDDLIYIRSGQMGVRLAKATGTLYAPASVTRAMTAGRSVEVADVNGDGKLDIYALQGNGAPGCTTCKTNYPDHLYLGDGAGHFTETPIPNVTGGSGDTVDAIHLTPTAPASLLVANGANLIAGPLELLTAVIPPPAAPSR
jgi:VCBS repeat protein